MWIPKEETRGLPDDVGSQTKSRSETKPMSELKLELIRNIATIFAGEEDPLTFTQHMHWCSSQECSQNYISNDAQLALSKLVTPSIDTSQQPENDDITIS
jgi:hypothetical protein